MCIDRTWAPLFAPKRNRCAADIPLDFAAKASIAVGVDGLVAAASPGPSAGLVVVQESRQARCVAGERGHGYQAKQQTSKEQDRSKGRPQRHKRAARYQRAGTQISQSAGTV